MGKDRELADHERAHSGTPGAKVRHGADATGKVRYSPQAGSNEQIQTARDAVHKALTKKGFEPTKTVGGLGKHVRYEHPERPGHRVLVKEVGHGQNNVEWQYHDKPSGGYGRDSGSVGPQFYPYKQADDGKIVGRHGGNETSGLDQTIDRFKK